jgi:hypothetical protein
MVLMPPDKEICKGQFRDLRRIQKKEAVKGPFMLDLNRLEIVRYHTSLFGQRPIADQIESGRLLA